MTNNNMVSTVLVRFTRTIQVGPTSMAALGTLPGTVCKHDR